MQNARGNAADLRQPDLLADYLSGGVTGGADPFTDMTNPFAGGADAGPFSTKCVKGDGRDMLTRDSAKTEGTECHPEHPTTLDAAIATANASRALVAADTSSADDSPTTPATRAATPSHIAAPPDVSQPVNSIDEAFQASDYHLEQLLKDEFGFDKSGRDEDEIDSYLHELMEQMNKPWSSCCSGVEACGASRAEMAMAIQRRLSHASQFAGLGTPIFSIGKDKACCVELDLLWPKEKCPQYCHFHDFEDFLAPEVVRIKDVLMQKTGHEAWAALLPVIKLGVATQRACVRHGKPCEAREADSHDGCTPCTAFSPNNMQHPGLADPTLFVLVAFCSHRNSIQEKRSHTKMWSRCGSMLGMGVDTSISQTKQIRTPLTRGGLRTAPGPISTCATE